MESIGIPDSVTIIGENTFRGCTNLNEVTLSKSLDILGHGAFRETAITEILIPKSLTTTTRPQTVGGSADYGPFNNCKQLKSVMFEPGITTIAKELFANCPELESIEIPNTVTIIGADAFRGCTKLSEVTLSKSLDILEDRAFMGTAITSIYIPKSLTRAGSVTSTIYMNGYGPFINTPLKYVEFEEGAIRIAQRLFADCSVLESIEIPDTVTTIENNAFRNAVSLKDIVIPNSVTSIHESAFHGCKSLTSVVLPNTLTSIQSSVFQDCSSLVEITLPATITTIQRDAFNGCASLPAINLPDGLQTINNNAFSGCKSLLEINFPDGLQTIGSGAFRYANALKEITIPSSVSSIGSDAFRDCLALETATINASGSIGADSFSDNISMKTLHLADTVTSIGARMAQGNVSLTDVRLGQHILTIPNSAFSSCSSLVEITIPYFTTTIEANAFTRNTALEKVYIPPSVTSIQTNSFSYQDKTAIHGKSGSYAQTYAFQRDFTFVPEDIPITLLSFQKSEMDIGRDKTYLLPINIEPGFNTDTITYTSSDTKVATVNAITGSVKTTNFGTADITATNGTLTTKITLNVGINSPTLTPAPTATPVPTTTPTPTPTPTPTLVNGDVEAFVTRIYNNVLEREPDPEGLIFWSNGLRTGVETASSIIDYFFFGGEFMAKGIENDEFIQIAYLTFMDRDADPDGMTHWLTTLESGFNRRYVVNQMILSPEFENILEEYGIELGPVDGAAGYVARMYRNVFARNYDQEGLAYWLDGFANGTQSGASIAEYFFFQEEFLKRNVTSGTFVEIAYATFMNRDPDPEGFNHWVSTLEGGTDPKDVLNFMINSDEFANICDGYGIEVGQMSQAWVAEEAVKDEIFVPVDDIVAEVEIIEDDEEEEPEENEPENIETESDGAGQDEIEIVVDEWDVPCLVNN